MRSSSTHVVELCFAKTRARMSWNSRCCSISARVCGASPVKPVGGRTVSSAGFRPVRELDRLQEHLVELLLAFQAGLGRIDNLLEVNVQRERAEADVRGLSDFEGDARNQLVLAVDDPGVEPAAGNIRDLERLLEVDGLAARARRQEPDASRHRNEPADPALRGRPSVGGGQDRHAGIVDQNTRASVFTFCRISSRLVGSA